MYNEKVGGIKMKTILKIFNIVIMAIAALATVFLFVTPTVSFNSKVCVDIATFSQFVPTTPYTEDLDIVALLGTDEIQVGVKFTLNSGETSKVMNKDKQFVNDGLIGPNIDDIVGLLHDPVDLITEYYVRTFLKSLIKDEITIQVDAAREKYASSASESGVEIPPTEEIMEEVGMDDDYFDHFTFSLYRAADQEDATIDSVTEVLYVEIDEALARAEQTGFVDTSGYTESSKEALKEDVVSNLEAMELVDEGGKVKRISQMSFNYLANYLKQELDGKVPASELEKKTEEDYFAFSNRLLRLFLYNQIPDDVYQIMGYVALALFIAKFVFAAVWILLIIITLFRTLLSKKPWTIFGPWFWFVGGLQIVMGIVLTYLGKIVLPSVDLSSLAALNIPIRSIILAPRTFALIPSILYIICLPLSIVYGFFKRRVRRQIRQEKEDD